ncbi:MAG: DUF6298 domain-containing protein [Nitrospirales bacterium]
MIGWQGCSQEDLSQSKTHQPCPDPPQETVQLPLPITSKESPRDVSLPKIKNSPGLLAVHPQNAAYFQNRLTGDTVFLHGFDHFRGLQEANNNGVAPLHFQSFIDQLKSYNHNFLRLWVWEHFWRISEINEVDPEGEASRVLPPHIYQRTGPGNAIDGQPKFDLFKFDQRYFDRMRRRIINAGESGIWVSVMLFQGWSIEGLGPQSNTQWQGHPFNSRNNINGINGDYDQDGNGWEVHTRTNPRINTLHEAYVKKVIDTVGDLDNVLYEISNESVVTELSGRCHHITRVTDWSYDLIDLIHRYEQEQGYGPHPVGLSGFRPIPGDPPLRKTNPLLFASPAEYISPSGSLGPGDTIWKDDPPAATGEKVIIADSDHIQPEKHGGPGLRSWLWRTFTRGHNLNAVDGDPQQGANWFSSGDSKTMQAMARYVARVKLVSMRPYPDLSSTAYCLADPGDAYIVYQPMKEADSLKTGQSFQLDLQSGEYEYEWFNPTTNEITQVGQIIMKSTGDATFTPPFNDHAVLFLKRNTTNPQVKY